MKTHTEDRQEYIARTRQAREFSKKTHQEIADAIAEVAKNVPNKMGENLK